MVATIGPIRHNVGVLQVIAGQDHVAGAKLSRHCPGLLQLPTGSERRVGREGQHAVWTQRVEARRQQIGTIRASRVGNGYAGQFAQDFLQSWHDLSQPVLLAGLTRGEAIQATRFALETLPRRCATCLLESLAWSLIGFRGRQRKVEGAAFSRLARAIYAYRSS